MNLTKDIHVWHCYNWTALCPMMICEAWIILVFHLIMMDGTIKIIEYIPCLSMATCKTAIHCVLKWPQSSTWPWVHVYYHLSICCVNQQLALHPMSTPSLGLHWQTEFMAVRKWLCWSATLLQINKVTSQLPYTESPGWLASVTWVELAGKCKHSTSQWSQFYRSLIGILGTIGWHYVPSKCRGHHTLKHFYVLIAPSKLYYWIVPVFLSALWFGILYRLK